MIFTRDFVTRENHWQIASLVTPKSLFTVTHCIILYTMLFELLSADIRVLKVTYRFQRQTGIGYDIQRIYYDIQQFDFEMGYNGFNCSL